MFNHVMLNYLLFWRLDRLLTHNDSYSRIPIGSPEVDKKGHVYICT